MTTGGAREPFTTLITFGLLAHASELVLVGKGVRYKNTKNIKNTKL